ncbi:H-2 class I histocompatibility antigen, Q10 alpha chain-like isoform X2 [Solea senegalensis]|uniref:H-2 class I histocompatibility antigen, Q10 alpha chain-like isoform X2 n=1 Tax=Solea senegalensis TaxID=28829 RepID=A0AAV6R5R5_SOLSE|nr:H-2 class I histocompatibility antigen, Q10 alpha chain-like [Solea senegalensis]KAG7500723.1 H-2 class I histocompatibility antigen, Q10 alpha chain-like isoform X2 [Solea senegalensis]
MWFVKTGVVFVYFCGVFVLQAAVSTENSDIHSLTYIYTAFSHKPSLPGFHQFTAEGRLDGVIIDYFDSDGLEKIPNQPWMKENLPKSYWSRGTETRKSKQQWFDVNIGILMERLRQNNSDLHTLQWMHGCKAKRLDDGQLSFSRALDMYSYDGNDFLSFDDVHDAWYSSNSAATETIRKWDQVSTLKVYTRSYLESDCLRWMKDFLGYREKFLNVTAPPEVVIYAARSHVESSVRLTCFATGFHLKDIELRMRRNGEIIDRSMGLTSSGVRPNHDNTYQRKDSVEIFKSDKSQFTCEVVHAPSRLHVTEVWDRTLPSVSSNVPIIAGGLIGFLVVMVVPFVLLLLFKKKIIGLPFKSGTNNGSNPSLGSSQSSGSHKLADGNPVEKDSLITPPMEEGAKTSLNGSDSGVSV